MVHLGFIYLWETVSLMLSGSGAKKVWEKEHKGSTIAPDSQKSTFNYYQGFWNVTLGLNKLGFSPRNSLSLDLSADTLRALKAAVALASICAAVGQNL